MKFAKKLEGAKSNGVPSVHVYCDIALPSHPMLQVVVTPPMSAGEDFAIPNKSSNVLFCDLHGWSAV
eukprot:COSAG04_NODE_23874_length_330_cov_1.792208_1_plen_66_part_10